MKKFKALLVAMVVIASLVTFAACATGEEQPAGDDGQAEAKTPLKIGTIAACRFAAESGISLLEEMGYEVEIVMFDDYITPDSALDEGSIDANIYQHESFMNNYNAEHGTDLAFLAPVAYTYGGIYSTHYTSIDDLKANGAGGQFAIANDATNQSLDLQVIEAAGLITLVDEEKEIYGLPDIVDNPYNFEFVYMARNVIYSSRDELAAYIGISNSLVPFGLDPEENRLFASEYVDNAVGITVRAEDAESQLAQDLIAAYTSDEAKQYIRDNSDAAMLPME